MSTARPKTSNRPLTTKQKAFVDVLVNNPKTSATQAILQTYGKPGKPPTYQTAQQLAHENLTKPNVQLYMDKHIEKAKSKIISLIDSEKDDIALRASDSVLDRALGKATQRVEAQSTSVNITIEL
jgi:hypothetical protein